MFRYSPMQATMKLIIKNHRNKNKYLLTPSGMWVRNLSTPAAAEDINDLIPESDYRTILENEMKNATLNIASIDAESIFAPNVIIVSDGYKFEEKQHILQKFPQDKVTIIGTNRALAKWARHTRMDWYVANNPYRECMTYLPSHSYYPRCIVSNRTNPEFIKRYRARLGVVYRYTPVSDGKFASNYFQAPIYYVDDYRNSICAAMSLAFRWEVQRLMLFCCDSVFEGERPGAIQLPNGLWMYPQHEMAHDMIDGISYWLKSREHINVKIADHSAGPEYKNLTYINEDELLRFFD